MLRTGGAIAALLGVIWLPGVGEYVAIVVVTFATLLVAIVHEKIAPLSASVGKAIGQRSEFVTMGVLVSIPLAIGVFALVRACFDHRRSEEYGSAGIALIGMLAIAASSYFRFGFRY